jgi:UDPglucose--hexose-1-phosphate uridylyltransferase
MSVIRQDPTTKDWVIIAPNRGKRPHDTGPTPAAGSQASWEASCPFCPGNESRTPPEVWRLAAPHGSGWAVRVIPNKFGALTGQGASERREDGPLFQEMAGVGYHEVIVETPVHNRPLPLMTDAEVERVLTAYQARYHALQADPRVKSIVLFKNHGARAGTSLAHPHAQLVAMPVAPMQVRRKYAVALSHYDDTGRCLYCDLVQAEVQARVRVVLETARFVVLHPFASRVPFETWILPIRHQASFGQVSAEDLRALAQVLRATLRALYDCLGVPDFNALVQTAPLEDEAKPYYLWHLQIVPRITTMAGFELGSGMAISTMMPEESAALMREVMA